MNFRGSIIKHFGGTVIIKKRKIYLAQWLFKFIGIMVFYIIDVIFFLFLMRTGYTQLQGDERIQRIVEQTDDCCANNKL